jgi:hypothetical protein
MHRTSISRWSAAAVATGVAAFLSQAPGNAQAVTGNAHAVQATVASPTGVETTRLADTGTLGGATDAREASAPTGSIASLLSGETLHATTIGWQDQVSSEASIAGLALTIDANTISADFVQARVMAGRRGSAAVNISGLTVNGIAIDVTGNPNQQVPISGGTIVINEQTTTSAGTVVNALHIVVNGRADVIIASATANAQ